MTTTDDLADIQAGIDLIRLTLDHTQAAVDRIRTANPPDTTTTTPEPTTTPAPATTTAAPTTTPAPPPRYVTVHRTGKVTYAELMDLVANRDKTKPLVIAGEGPGWDGGWTLDLAAVPRSKYPDGSTAFEHTLVLPPGVKLVGGQILNGIVAHTPGANDLLYCDIQGDVTDWLYRKPPVTGPWVGKYPVPRTVQVKTFAKDVGYLGCRIHNTRATAFYLEGYASERIRCIGCAIYGMDPRFGNIKYQMDWDATQGDEMHMVPGPSSPPGGFKDLLVQQTVMCKFYVLFKADAGGITNLAHDDFWFVSENPSPMGYEAVKGHRIVNATRNKGVFLGSPKVVGYWKNGSNDPWVAFGDMADGSDVQTHYGRTAVAQAGGRVDLKDLTPMQYGWNPAWGSGPTTELGYVTHPQSPHMRWLADHRFEDWPELVDA